MPRNYHQRNFYRRTIDAIVDNSIERIPKEKTPAEKLALEKLFNSFSPKMRSRMELWDMYDKYRNPEPSNPENEKMIEDLIAEAEKYKPSLQTKNPIDHRTQYVYIFMMGPCIKVGTSRTTKRRLIAIQNACPYPVHSVVQFEGNELIEKMLHAVWHKYRLKGEWFQITEEIAAFIKGAHEAENKEAYLHEFLQRNDPR